MNEQSSQFKHQDPVRVNSLKRLEGSKKPHILSQNTELGQRSLVSLKAVKKIAKREEQLFLAVDRPISLNPSKQMKTNSSALAAAHAQGRIEGEKRKQIKLEGLKRTFNQSRNRSRN